MTRIALAALLLAVGARVHAQATPSSYEILGISVEGLPTAELETFAVSVSQLQPGSRVQLPYDEAFGIAVRKLYKLGRYSDAEVVVDRIVGDGVFLTLRLEVEPVMGELKLEGLSSGEKEDVRPRISLLTGRATREAELEQARLTIQEYLRDKGFRLATVDLDTAVGDDGRMTVTMAADKGERITVGDVVFEGNDVYAERTLRKRLKNTPERRWWRFWKRETFSPSGFEEDKDALIRYYNDRGYYGARVVRDSVYVRTEEDGDSELVVEIEVDEGAQYHVREVVFEGNTVYTDEQLRLALGVERGDVYNRSLIERNLRYTQDHTDLSSLYSDRGYLRFNVAEQVVEAPGDSLDLYFEITEGDVYEFGSVQIAGNTRTQENVIRRELRTVPGETYSRQAIERSVRDLIQLSYFDQASLGAGPSIRVNEEDQTVDLTYNLTETSSDQLELSGGYGGFAGLLLTARVTFNNFSAQNLFNGRAWNPIPSGDGQQLALQVVTNGRGGYQNYSLSFTEPWFRGKPTPVGFSLGYQNNSFRGSDRRIRLLSTQAFARSRLRWPDDFFQTGSTVSYRLYDIETGSTGSIGFGLPQGVSQELTLRQTLTRNSLDNPLFPSAGSNLNLSATIAPPIPGFIQYWKADFNNAWYAPVAPRVALAFKTQLGYIGSLTGGDVEFQRYLVGGSPLQSNRGYLGIGKDLVYLRGYPSTAIGPREDGDAVGGRILNKYQAELQIVALQSPQLSFAPYAFVDAANTWDGFADYDPSDLYRSAGFGSKLFLPIIGLVDLNMGYGFDRFQRIENSSDTGEPRWRFQVTLGNSF